MGGTGEVRFDELRWAKDGRGIFWDRLTANDVRQANVAFFTLLSRQVYPQDGRT